MNIPQRTTANLIPQRGYSAWTARAKNTPLTNASLNTLDQVLAFTRSYSAEIRQDTKARRIYKSFVALTNSPFEALLAFSLWKVRNLPLGL